MNTVQLDNGLCGQNSQLGLPNYTNFATPRYLLYGDGGAATYNISLDGSPIGQFRTSDMYGNVCIQQPTALSDGSHTITGDEVSPHVQSVTPYTFVVDTVIPPTPITTSVTINPPSTSGNSSLSVRGTLSSTSDVRSIRIYQGQFAGIGGAPALMSWTGTSTPLTPGTYSITSSSIDKAGNVSVRSNAVSVTITASTASPTPAQLPSAPSSTPIPTAAPTVPNAPVNPVANFSSVKLTWSVPATSGSPITAYRIYRGPQGAETLLATVSNSTFTYTDIAPISGSWYRITAVNAIGEGTSTISFQAQ